MTLLHTLAFAAFPIIVIVAALRDATSYTIPNWISVAGAAAFLPAALIAGLPLPLLLLALGVGLAALVAGMVMFALNWIGGGDAKLFAACGVWVGLSAFAPFLMWTAVTGGLLAVVLLYARKLSARLPARTPEWLRRLLTPGESVPYGVAIAIGALIAFPGSAIFRALG